MILKENHVLACPGNARLQYSSEKKMKRYILNVIVMLTLAFVLQGAAVPAEAASAKSASSARKTSATAAAAENTAKVPARNLKKRLSYDVYGNFYDRKGYPIRKGTISKLLQVALQPVGRTLYIWGGGWASRRDRYGDWGSSEASTIGVSSRWERFFNRQGKWYNHRNYRYQEHLGLDCSGYVGWVLYNTFNTENGHGDYVMGAQYMARTFASWGWGKYKYPGTFRDYKAGDVMSLSAGHVYIVIGQCADGSVVLVHSSPKGVQITGTYTRKGKRYSQAVKLAKYYMKRYYPKWYKKFPKCYRDTSYLTKYSRMRWNLYGRKSVMSDPDGLTSMNAAQVLKFLFRGAAASNT